MYSVVLSDRNTLLVAALGIVFGDIGTSPIYTFRECFMGANIEASLLNIYGIASITFWLMCIVVSIKYVTFVLRADNNGEGGILALYALLIEKMKQHKHRGVVSILGLVGAALFWGDSVITPAISVLSAVEGLSYVSHSFKPWVLPITVVILLVLFLHQKYGTEKIGILFGPIMTLWFTVLGVLGILHIIDNPTVLSALNPYHAFRFLAEEPKRLITVMGFAILVVTGVEALYADMGHFKKNTIHVSWLFIVFPCLTLNYLGQASVLIKKPHSIDHLFFSMAPDQLLIPFVILATLATIIASQAVISGIFSLALQAIQLGILPPFKIIYTSAEHKGRIYIPLVNITMLVHVLFIVLFFESSTALAGMYGLAVSAIMVLTTILILWVAHTIWLWSWGKLLSLALLIVPVDFTLFLANLHKLEGGAVLPVFVSIIALFVMFSWRHGEAVKRNRSQNNSTTVEQFGLKIRDSQYVKTKGVGIYLSPYPDHMPHTFFHAVEHIMAVPKQTYSMSILFHNQAYIQAENRIEVKKLYPHFTQIVAHYGYMQHPNMGNIIRLCSSYQNIDISGDDVTFYVARSIPVVKANSFLEYILETCYVFFARNVLSFISRVKIADSKVIQIGRRFLLD